MFCPDGHSKVIRSGCSPWIASFTSILIIFMNGYKSQNSRSLSSWEDLDAVYVAKERGINLYKLTKLDISIPLNYPSFLSLLRLFVVEIFSICHWQQVRQPSQQCTWAHCGHLTSQVYKRLRCELNSFLCPKQTAVCTTTWYLVVSRAPVSKTSRVLRTGK